MRIQRAMWQERWDSATSDGDLRLAYILPILTVTSQSDRRALTRDRILPQSAVITDDSQG